MSSTGNQQEFKTVAFVPKPDGKANGIPAPLLALPDGIIAGTYPFGSSVTQLPVLVNSALPSIMFSDPLFPWIEDATTPRIWLALLLFDEAEFENGLVKEQQVATSSLPVSVRELDPSIKSVNSIWVNNTLLSHLLPTVKGPELFTHLRGFENADGKVLFKESVVPGNRFPLPNSTSKVHLVLKDTKLTGTNDTTGFISLYSWEFSTLGEYAYKVTTDTVGKLGQSGWAADRIILLSSFENVFYSSENVFKEELEKKELNTLEINQVLLRAKFPRSGFYPTFTQSSFEPLPICLSPESGEDRSLYTQGFVPDPGFPRFVFLKNAWYHGPLVHFLTSGKLPHYAYNAGDVVIEETGLGVDISYAEAWDLGRLQALRDQKFVNEIAIWKSWLHRNTAPPNEYISNWIQDIIKLRMVPRDHLIPVPELLPENSVRYFKVDTAWIQAQMEGAFSVGRSLEAERDKDMELRLHSYFPTLPDHLGGIIVRAEALANWPLLEIVGWSGSDEELTQWSIVRLEEDILLAIFEGHPAAVGFRPKTEELYPGFNPGYDEEGISINTIEFRDTTSWKPTDTPTGQMIEGNFQFPTNLRLLKSEELIAHLIELGVDSPNSADLGLEMARLAEGMVIYITPPETGESGIQTSTLPDIELITRDSLPSDPVETGGGEESGESGEEEEPTGGAEVTGADQATGEDGDTGEDEATGEDGDTGEAMESGGESNEEESGEFESGMDDTDIDPEEETGPIETGEEDNTEETGDTPDAETGDETGSEDETECNMDETGEDFKDKVDSWVFKHEHLLMILIVILGALILVVLFSNYEKGKWSKPDFLVDRFEGMRGSEEMRFIEQFYEELIPITNTKNKLEFMVQAPASIYGYMDMSELEYEIQGKIVLVTLPVARVSNPIIDLDSIREYNFANRRNQILLFNKTKKFESAFSDIITTFKQTKKAIRENAIQNDILQDVDKQARIYIIQTAASMGYQVQFKERKSENVISTKIKEEFEKLLGKGAEKTDAASKAVKEGASEAEKDAKKSQTSRKTLWYWKKE